MAEQPLNRIAECDACAVACLHCAAPECARHEADHCQRCAEACRRCAQACGRVVA